LADCIREALDANPDLSAMAARAAASNAAALAAAAGRRPQLGLAAGYFYSERAQRLAQPSYPGEDVRYVNGLGEAAVEIAMPLYSGGGLRARTKAANLDAAARREMVTGTRQDLVLSVAATYLAAVRSRAAIEAVEGSLDALEGQLDVARTLEEVGRIPPLDRLKVEVRAAAVRQLLSRARRDRELVMGHLATLVGRDADNGLSEVGAAPSPLPVTEDASALLRMALELRPEVRAARFDVDRARQELALARAEGLPAVDVYARYVARAAVPYEDDSMSGQEHYGTTGLTFTQPLWTGGELGARRAERRALVIAAEAGARGAELRVAEEVRVGMAAFVEARERIGVAREALEQAREAFAVERDNYELGRSTVNDVLDAQGALLDAELARAEAEHDVALASAALARATGQDLSARLLAH
jgi:outer membrane protein